MWQSQPVPPNVPAFMVDFINVLASCIKDSKQLAPMVKAAQDIAEANRVSEEGLLAQAAAQKIIEDAGSARQGLTETLQQIENDKIDVAKAERAVAVRETQCDERTTELNGVADKQAKEAARLDKWENGINGLKVRENVLVEGQQKLADDRAAHNDKVAKDQIRAKKINTAASLIQEASAG